MASNPSLNRSTQRERMDPFAMQLALSTVHARLVPMRRGMQGYELDPSTNGWFELPSGRGFAGYGLGRALRMLLDVLRGLTALHDTFDATGENFAHGDVALPQLRIDFDGVCRLVPLTRRHSSNVAPTQAAREALGHLAPERLLGEAVDVRADVFSAGALLWEALAGRRLFEETSGDAIIDRLMAEKLQMPQLPPELAWAIPLKAVAARALSVDPYQRFADCAELATAIAIVARERVASHAEIARFFGAPPRSAERRAAESVRLGPDQSALSALIAPSSGQRVHGTENSPADSVPSRRPIPTRSSTFPAAIVPSSRRSSTLAPLGPARSLTPPPSTRPTPAPSTLAALGSARSVTPAPVALGPARSVTPVPATLRAPSLATPAPSRLASRSAPHGSPFSALLSAESRAPVSEPASSGRRTKTLMSFGTPSSVVEPQAAEPEMVAAPASVRPPPLPTQATLPTSGAASALPKPITLSFPAAPTAVPPPLFVRSSDAALEEAVAFRASTRRTWLIVALLAAAALGWLAFTQLASGPDSKDVQPTQAATAPAAARAATLPADDHAPAMPPAEPSVTPVEPAPTRAAAAAASSPAVHAPAPRAPAKASAKDYGI